MAKEIYGEKNISIVVSTLWEELTGKGHERGFWEDENVPYFVEKGVSQSCICQISLSCIFMVYSLFINCT